MSVSYYEFLNYQFYPETRTLVNIESDQKTHLEPKVADLLFYFLQNPQRVISKEQLVKQVWQDSVITDNSISWAISQLRKALSDQPQTPSYIKTYPKKGYQFLPSASIVSGKLNNNIADENLKPASSLEIKTKNRPQFIYKIYFIFAAIIILLFSFIYFQSQVDNLTKLENIKNVTNLDGAEEDPRLSPNGDLLLFRHKKSAPASQFQLNIADLNAQNKVHQLTDDQANYVSAIWGENDKTIFAVKVEKTDNNYECKINAYTIPSIKEKLTIHKTLHRCDAVSATSLAYHQPTHTLYFTDKINDNNYAVYSLNLTTNEIKQLTDPVQDGLGDSFISFDLAHQKLLILRDAFWSQTEFLSLNLQSNQLKSLLSIKSRYYKAYFSPNSDRIWLNSGNDVLISYDPKKEQTTPLLTNTFGWNYNLAPANKTEAYFSVSDPNYGDIVINQNSQLTTQTTQYTERLPTVSSDGKTLSYVSNKTGTPQIWLRNLQNKEEKQITTSNEYKEYRQLVWSPKNDWLLVTSQNNIAAYHPKKGIKMQVTTTDFGIFYPSFSLDGETIFFSSVVNGDWQAYQVPFKSNTTKISRVLPDSAWLVKQVDDYSLLYSKPHQDGLFKFDMASKTSAPLFKDFPKNDYWVLAGNKLYFRQTEPDKSLQVTSIDNYQPRELVKLPSNSNELFSITSSGELSVFSTTKQKQSDIKKATITY